MEPLRADDIIDRQRLRRKLTFWRIIGVVAVLAMIGGLVATVGGDRFGPQTRDHVAHVRVTGAMTGDERMLEVIESVRKAEMVRGVIVTIDSPGGTTAAGEALYEAVRALAEDKPVVAQVDTLAASAGYMVAAAADRIVARQSSLVGSIGVIVQYPNFDGLLRNWGIDVRAIKSSPLKAEPSFFGEPPPGAEAMIRRVVLDSYDWFKDLVAERRGFDAATIDRLADGSIFTGRQALENGLVDQLGGEKAARDWLTEQGVDAELKTVDWKPRSQTGLFGLPSVSAMIGQVWGEPGALALAETVRQRLALDGLVSLWHADLHLSPQSREP